MDVENMKVPDLKRELKNRGLSQAGLKAALVQRLKEALESESAGNGEKASTTATEKVEEEAPTSDTKEEEPAKTEEPNPESEKSNGKVDKVDTEEKAVPTKRKLDEVEGDKEESIAKKPKQSATEFETSDNLESLLTEDTTLYDITDASIEEAEETKKPSSKSRQTSRSNDTATSGSSSSPKILRVVIEETPPNTDPSPAIIVRNFVRPFPLSQAKSLLSEDAEPQHFWMDKFRSYAYVVFESVEQATKTKDRIDGMKWPEKSTKVLSAQFCPETEALFAMAKDGQLANAGTVIPAGLTSATAFQTSSSSLSSSSEIVPSASSMSSSSLSSSSTLRKSLGSPTPQEEERERERDRGDRERERDRERDREREREKDRAPSRPAFSLDERFKKTKTQPYIYWLPASDAVVEENKKRLAEKNKKR